MSREIFRKVKSYVVYRIACSIFIVLTLCILVFISACSVDSVLIVLLALLNDISMLPIAHDKVAASRNPEIPKVKEIIIRCVFFGLVSTAIGMLYFYTINPMGDSSPGPTYLPFANIHLQFFCSTQTSALIWLYMTILSESLIFTVRVPHGWFWTKPYPSPLLIISVLLTDIVFSVLAGVWHNMFLADIMITWAFGLGSFFFVDCMKMLMFVFILGEDSGETISFEEFKEGLVDIPEGEEDLKLKVEGGINPDLDPDVEAAEVEVDRMAAKEKRLSNHRRHTLEGSDRDGHREIDHNKKGPFGWIGLNGRVAKFHRAHMFHTHRDPTNVHHENEGGVHG